MLIKYTMPSYHVIYLIKITLKRLKEFLFPLIFYYRILIFISFFSFLSFINQNIANAQYKIKTVVIDAGHGGKDPGALGKKTKEKNLTLAIALKLGNYIHVNMPGVKVIYTRQKDEFIELYKRAEIANKNKADVFISIHVNANTSPKPYGTSTYVMGLHKSDENLDVAKLENSVILKEEGYKQNYKGFDPNSPESHIILTLLQNAHLDQSLNLASKVQDQFRTRAGRKDIGVRQAGLVVLWNATMPAILVETGFISNAEEEKYLMTDQGQSFIASAIYRAFRDYKNELEKNSKGYTSVNTNNSANKDHKVLFRVQIKISANKIKENSEALFGFNDVKEYFISGIYKYYVGQTSDFREILKLQTIIREKVPDAFVVAFKNDKPISISEAMKEIGRK
jgi:N-acetylmuramoyl-L-alanine amidase